MLKMMKEHEEHLCGKPTNTTAPPKLPQDEWSFEGPNLAEREGAGTYMGGASAYMGGAMESAGLDQSWMDALNACREEGQSVDSIIAQNLAQENHIPRPVEKNIPSNKIVCSVV